MVGTSAISSLPPDLAYLVYNMHSLTWAYKWYIHKSDFNYQPRQGPNQNIPVDEPVCLIVRMDKKYRTTDKKVVFITNCIPAIPTSLQEQCHRKNIRDEKFQYTRQLIASAPILKAYNYRMGGVDKHDRLVGQHTIPLTAKRGYTKYSFTYWIQLL